MDWALSNSKRLEIPDDRIDISYGDARALELQDKEVDVVVNSSMSFAYANEVWP